MKKRPIGVTILAVLAALAAVFAGYRVLQFLGLFPFWLGPLPFKMTCQVFLPGFCITYLVALSETVAIGIYAAGFLGICLAG